MFPSLIQSAKFLNPQYVVDQIDLHNGMQVADFGCGTGDFVLAVATVVGSDGQVNAIDIQDSALSSVRSKSRINGNLNIRLIKANLEIYNSSGLDYGSQDAVLMTNILFQSNNKREILREGFRVLRKEGLLIFVDWKKDANFGSARGWRLSREDATRLIEEEGFKFQKEIAAGAFHFGMIFVRN
ncbi:MAG: methyltransferase domain-containing protein [Patescibacteria group bacterium]